MSSTSETPAQEGIYIRLEDVDLDLPLGKTLRGMFSPRARAAEEQGSRIFKTEGGAYVSALSRVTLNIEAGDRIGLIGPNGAGKSSLLRLLAGIYTPTRGKRTSHGKISTLLTSTVGMHQNATGRENIFWSGRTLGLSRAKIEELEPAIVEFADLGEFIDLPLHAYSSGMRTRLGFGIATALDPEILLIDEVFAVGDAAFREKAEARMKDIMARAGILAMATHSNGVIQQFCSKVCWLDRGHIKFCGDVTEGLALYAASNKP